MEKNKTFDLRDIIATSISDPLCGGQDRGIYMRLNLEPYSIHAAALVADIWGHHAKTRFGPNAKSKMALGALIGELLRISNVGNDRYGYRTIRPDAFSRKRIGFRPLKDATDCLGSSLYLRILLGERKTRTASGRATRFRPTQSLLDLAKGYGIEPANYQSHFRVSEDGKDAEPVVLKTSSTKTMGRYGQKIAGTKITLPKGNPAVQAASKTVTEINQALRKHSYSVEFHGLQRIFNNGDTTGTTFNEGGRLYAIGGSYQTLCKADRRKMLINGDPVVEIDLAASHYTIALAMLGYGFDAGNDPYNVSGVPRVIVKAYVTACIGNGKPIHGWPAFIKEEYADYTCHKENRFEASLTGLGVSYSGDLQNDWPIALMKKKVLPLVPILQKLEGSGLNWAKLQYRESEMIVDTVYELAVVQGIGALPVHDSLILPVEHEAQARAVLDGVFYKAFGIHPKIA